MLYVGGPRQAGKTTLLRQVLGKKAAYVNLEDPSVRARFGADPRGFLEALGRPAIFDEVQLLPELLTWIKVFVDEDRRAGSYALTGSQALAVMHGVSQSLAGRVAVLDLLPLGAEELRVGRSAVRAWNRLLGPAEPGPKPKGVGDLGTWLLRGAYPEPRLNPRVDRQTWLSSYVQTYLERDVRSLLRVGDLAVFERFLRLCAARTGQILNLAELGRDCGVSLPTAKNWISVLSASQIVFLLPPWHKNFGKRLVKSPKLYFVDTGLACFLLDIHGSEGALRGPAAGPLFETAVISSWRRALKHRGMGESLYWWRSSDGLEVDLLIEADGRLHAFEVKSSTDPTPVHAQALLRFAKLAQGTRSSLKVIHGGDRLLAVAEGVQGLPWWWV